MLNFRNRGNLKIKGDVKINGQVINSPVALAAISGYVQQEDLFMGTMKVKEQLKFQVIKIKYKYRNFTLKYPKGLKNDRLKVNFGKFSSLK